MYAIYANEINKEDSYIERTERASDIQLPPMINTLLLGTWIAISLIGFAIIFLAKNPVVGAIIIAVPTFIGMVIKPTFALCMVMLVLPTGAGIGYKQLFSLDRGVGLALAVSFALNFLISRPKLRIGNKVIWVMGGYTIWIILVSLSAPYLGMELQRAFTQVQLLVLTLIVYWILETNGEKTFRWALRSYVIGTMGTIALAYKTGAAFRAMEEEGARYSATLGQAIDANVLAALTALALLAAIYLFARDKNILWRALYLAGILFLPTMLIRMAPRGVMIALGFTLLSPLLFVRQVLRRPAMAVLLVLAVVLASVSIGLLIKGGRAEEPVKRLTDIGYAKESISYRFGFIKAAVNAAVRMPMGTGYVSWFERAQTTHWPHNDFFLALGVYGIPGGLLFATFAIMIMFTVKRIPLGFEKMYARAILTFLLVNGLNYAQLFSKFFWLFLAVAMAAERIAWLSSGLSEELPEAEAPA